MICYKGKKIEFSINGSSHSNSLELVVKGLPKNIEISLKKIEEDLTLRNPKLFFNTQRNEKDSFNITKGVVSSKTTGEDVCVSFPNNSYDNKPYIKHDGFLRPSHSDYSQLLLSKQTIPGGGEFSGRMTLPIVFVGSIAKQILELKGIRIVSRIKSVYNLSDKELTEDDYKILLNLTEEERFFPTITKEFKTKSFEMLKNIKEAKDTVGGIIETVVINPASGLGGPGFAGLESKIASAIYGIPAIKGIEFGDGFFLSNKKGSEVADEFYLDNNQIKTKTNHNGGINGGVSNGMPITIKCAIKPVPTIKKPLTSLNYRTQKIETVVFEGDHDVFVGNRAIPSIEGMVAISLLDELLWTKKLT